MGANSRALPLAASNEEKSTRLVMSVTTTGAPTDGSSIDKHCTLLLHLMHKYPRMQHAIVTVGKEGAFSLSRAGSVAGGDALDKFMFRQVHPVVPVRQEVVDTTGAGDCFMAGLSYGYVHNFAFEEILACASVVAGYGVTAFGALGKTPKVHPKLAKGASFEHFVASLPLV
eukprot:gnl/TRDRNA2_/TRDRNA2_159963_c0_seq1.p1 gnl/TRDRNA2_/TRDRNA2_159963_c0~~gnl/TRDRNA2_/TRDRNA2_159963_c0_seq1.p1  ORF type:complete len:191 (+),score=14.29 gnl/TRDRNA2_/TRDRNA2_159963_c0_seq1:61-573(+)